MACIVIWLATLQISGSAVFYYLERFAMHDDGRYLLASATTLVCLNTLRAIFRHIGWFNLGAGSLELPVARWEEPFVCSSRWSPSPACACTVLKLQHGVPAIFRHTGLVQHRDGNRQG